MDAFQICQEARFTFSLLVFSVLVIFKVLSELATKFEDHYGREEAGLSKLVVRRDVRLIQNAKVWVDVDFALELFAPCPKQGGGFVLAIKQHNLTTSNTANRRLKDGVILKVPEQVEHLVEYQKPGL